MRELLPYAEKVAALLRARGDTVAVVESSAGGLIAAALLAVPGASHYFLGGHVLYTRRSWQTLAGYREDLFAGARAVTEASALIRARLIREYFSATWAVAETGAAGPTGNRYGDPAGHSCIAVAGPAERAATIRTGGTDRVANMRAFAVAALQRLEECLAKVGETK